MFARTRLNCIDADQLTANRVRSSPLQTRLVFVIGEASLVSVFSYTLMGLAEALARAHPPRLVSVDCSREVRAVQALSSLVGTSC